MPKYRKKPVVIDAVQWDGSDDSADVINDWAGKYIVDFKRDESKKVQLWVEANEAWLNLTPGEWVLHDSAGFYPCKPDIFEATYEEVTE